MDADEPDVLAVLVDQLAGGVADRPHGDQRGGGLGIAAQLERADHPPAEGCFELRGEPGKQPLSLGEGICDVALEAVVGGRAGYPGEDVRRRRVEQPLRGWPERRQEAVDDGRGRDIDDLGCVREQKALEADERRHQHALGEPVGEQDAVEHLLRGRAVELDPAGVALRERVGEIRLEAPRRED